jgi:antitoxin component YwqK of YwqJK toxin-antitoxin module
MNKLITITFYRLINLHYKIVLLVILFAVFQNSLFSQEKEFKQYFHENGKVSSEGMLLNGLPEGMWINYYPNGTVKSTGSRKNHELDSLWVFYSPEGIKTTAFTYLNGAKTGEATIYDKEGNISEIVKYENNVKQGEALYFFKTGELSKRVFFEKGKEQGEAFEYGKDGRIITLLKYDFGFIKREEKINRFDLEGRRQGLWIEFHKNGATAVEGNYNNGLKNGVFKNFDRDGNLLSLEKYENGLLVEDAEEIKVLDIQSTFYPDGSVRSSGGYNKNGEKEGIHRIYDGEGEVQGGEVYLNGTRVAEGIIDRSGYYQGFWKHYYPTGELRSEGEYVNSNKEGEWKFYFRNGKLEQKGKYLESKPHSNWVWYYENGQVLREETYRKGKEDGSSIEYSSEGETITSGEYANGLKEGEWFYKMGDHIETGGFLDGEKHGIWKHEYMNGKTAFIGEYVAGLEVGKHKYYFESGQLRQEGKYKSGLKDGDWKTFDEFGYITLVIKYKNGIEVKINGTKVQRGGEDEMLDSTPLDQ